MRRLATDFEPLVPNANEFALHNRVLPVRTKSGFKADIALGGIPFEEQAVLAPATTRLPKRCPCGCVPRKIW
jgi:hypothetical protein